MQNQSHWYPHEACCFFFLSLNQWILDIFLHRGTMLKGRMESIRLLPSWATCSVIRSGSEFPWVQGGCNHRLPASLSPCCCETRGTTTTTFSSCLVKRSSVGLLRRLSLLVFGKHTHGKHIWENPLSIVTWRRVSFPSLELGLAWARLAFWQPDNMVENIC